MYCSDDLLHLQNNFVWIQKVPLLFLCLFLEPLRGGCYPFFLARCRVSRIYPTLKNSALSREPLMAAQLLVDEKHILWLFVRFSSPAPSTSSSSSSFPVSGLPGPFVMGLVVVSQKALPRGDGAAPEAGRREKGGVYRPADAFQLLLLTPFQSKLAGLFQVSSGQSTVGFVVFSRSRGENSITLGKEEEEE